MHESRVEVRPGLTDEQRQRLAALSRKPTLTPYEAGQASAFALYALGEDRVAAEALLGKPVNRG